MSNSASWSYVYVVQAVVIFCTLVIANCAEKKGHNEPFGKQGPVQDMVEEKGFLDPETFFEKYCYQEVPVIMRGAAKTWPAFTKWTDEYLIKNAEVSPVGDVKVMETKDGKFSKNELFMNFGEFIKKRSSNKDLYLVDNVPNSIKSDVVLPFPLQCSKFKKDSLWRSVMTFSTGPVRSPIFSHSYDPIICVLRGSLKYIALDFNIYWGIAPTILTELRATEKYSLEDPDKLDLKNRQYWEGVEFYQGQVNAGDCIHPTYDWITQIITQKDTLTVGIYWYDRAGAPNFDTCHNESQPSWTIDKIVFKNESDTEEVDAYNTIHAFIVNKVKSIDELRNILSHGNADVKNNKEFQDLTSDLFKYCDMNGDGKIYYEDLKIRTDNEMLRNFKTGARRNLINTINRFNAFVTGLTEKKTAVPLYLYRSIGGVFTAKNSFGYPDSTHGGANKKDEL